MPSSLHPPKEFLPRRHRLSSNEVNEVHLLSSIPINPPSKFVRTGVFPIMKLPEELRIMLVDHAISPYEKPCWNISAWSNKFHWRRLSALLNSCQHLRAVTKQRISEMVNFLAQRSGGSIRMGLRRPDFMLELICHVQINLELVVRGFLRSYHGRLRTDC